MNIFNRVKNKIGNTFKKGLEFLKEKADDNPFARTIRKVGYAITGGTPDEFQVPEFDLQEIEDAYNTDSYVRQAMDKYSELMFKSDWEFVANNEDVHEYLDHRIMAMSDAMGIPFEEFLRNCADDLVKFSNVFLVKARQDSSEFPSHINVQGLGDQNPVAAYFRLPPQTMEILVDEHGTIQRYRQVSEDGDDVEFRPEDIIHITYKKPAGRFFGVPMSLPALDDVRLLREIEDNVARMIHKHLYPLFVYTIGKDKPGYEATDPEIEEARDEIRDMPNEGGFVLPERHNIEILSHDDGAMDAIGYLEYYEKRTFTGLGVTETLMGRGATSNRSTAENQSSELRDKVRAYQRAKQESVNYHIVRELLMEGGYDPVLNEDDRAKFVFNEIDTDLKIKQENHSIYKFEHNATTHEEMREELNKDPVTDEDRLNGNLFKNDSTETDNREDPENQHSSNEEIEIPKSLISRMSKVNLDLRNKVLDIIDYYQSDVINKNDFKHSLKVLVDENIKKYKIYSSQYIEESYKKGINSEKTPQKQKKDLLDTCKSGGNELESLADKEFSEFSKYCENSLLNSFKICKDDKTGRQSAIFLHALSEAEDRLYSRIKKLLSASFAAGVKEGI